MTPVASCISVGEINEERASSPNYQGTVPGGPTTPIARTPPNSLLVVRPTDLLECEGLPVGKEWIDPRAL